jgi:UDP-N-acetyl-2-amino-2-deoxyglucuronate dehydrogenase
MTKLKFGVIGCGRISYKGIEGILNNREDAVLVATCDPIEEKAIEKKGQYLKDLGEEVNVNTYKNYKVMIEEEEVDVVYIATESGYHPEIAIYCMNKGKHVICEKPMALSTSDADKMIECSRKNNVKLSISHQNRFNAPIQKLRREVECGNFGRITNGTARILWNRNMGYYQQAPWRGTWELDGGTLMNQCIHNIDLLQWMLGGEVDSVYAQCDTFLRDIEAEDFGAILIRFKNGAIGIVEGTACVYPKNLEETLSIFGEKGTVCIGGIAVNKIENWMFEKSEETEDEILKQQGEDPDTVYGFGHTALFKDVIEAIKYDREPLINGEEGKKAMEIILAAYKSRLTGQAVKFPIGEFSTMEMKNK